MVRVIPFGSLRASSPIWASKARLALLAQIGELARRLENFGKYRLCFEAMQFFYSF